MRNEEDYMLADFRYRVMLYALIMGGLVLLLQEVNDSKVRKGEVEKNIEIDPFILPFLRMDPATTKAQEVLQGIQMGAAIVEKGKNVIESNRKSDTTFISGSGKHYSDGTVSVDVIVNGDTSRIRTKNSGDSKRIRDDSKIKWTENRK